MIDFAEIRSTAQARLKNILARVIYGGVTGTDDGAQVVPDASADEGEEGAEVWQQWGFASRPLTGGANGVVEALVVPLEGGLVVLATRQQRTQVTVAPGEVVLFNSAAGCTVRLTAAGKVEITAANGQDIVLNGGTLRVARETDAVAPSEAMATWMSAVSTATMVGAAPAVIGTIKAGEGAPHVKA